MKITSMECYGGTFITVKVDTDEGVSGPGEAGLPYGNCQGVAWENCQGFTKIIVGMDPSDTEKTYEHLRRHIFWDMNGGVTVPAAMTATDIAYWNIKGEALGLPAYKSPGGRTHDPLWAYASQLQIGWGTLITKLDRSGLQPGPKDYYDAIKDTIADGYDVVKTDPCSVGLSREDFNRTYLKRGGNLKGAYPEVPRKIAMERIAAACEAGGDELDIVIEIHSTLDANTVVILGKSLEPHRITYYEEPTMPPNSEVLKYIRQKCDIPLVTGGRSYTYWGFRQFFEDRTLGIAQPGLRNTGSITEVKKIYDMASVYNTSIQPHVCGSPIAMATALHMETVISNFITYEEHCVNFKTDYQKTGKCVWAPESDRYMMNERSGISQEMSEEAMTPYTRAVVDQIFESKR